MRPCRRPEKGFLAGEDLRPTGGIGARGEAFSPSMLLPLNPNGARRRISLVRIRTHPSGCVRILGDLPLQSGLRALREETSGSISGDQWLSLWRRVDLS